MQLDKSNNLRGQVGFGYGAPAFLTQDAFGNTVQQAGTLSGPFGFEADAQYQTDNDSGLTLVGNRYYDSAVGRFLQPDPSGQEENEYAYASNNPLSFNDPDGLTNGPNKNQHPGKTGTRKGKGKKGKAKVADPTPKKPVKQVGPTDNQTIQAILALLDGFLSKSGNVKFHTEYTNGVSGDKHIGYYVDISASVEFGGEKSPVKMDPHVDPSDNQLLIDLAAVLAHIQGITGTGSINIRIEIGKQVSRTNFTLHVRK